MTSEHLSGIPAEHHNVPRSTDLDRIARGIITRVDIAARVAAAQGVYSEVDWRNYINPFITSAYDAGYSLTEDQAVAYIESYLGRPSEPSMTEQREVPLSDGGEAPGFMDMVREVARERLGEPAASPASPEPILKPEQGDPND